MSQGSSLSRATDYGLDERGSTPNRDKIFFLISTVLRPTLGLTQPPIEWKRGIFPREVERQNLQADHSTLSSAEIRNGGAVPPLFCTSSWSSV
jgi:hypothetical protein